MKKVYLFPGKLHADKETTEITTLLGSCVAVALNDPSTQIGGLNHYLLPEVMLNEVPNPRYGAFAIPALIDEVVALGANRSKLQAKIYGGGNVINNAKTGEKIGVRNIEMAETFLAKEKIPIIERNVGGEKGRKIILNTNTFQVVHTLNGEKAGENSAEVDISGFKKLDTLPKKVKVLVVDDSATVRTLFTNIFTKNGLEVVGAAADPYEARELLVSRKPDVMTLDIEMPKMTGVAFLEKVMKHSPIPVVMVSSLGAQGEAALKSLELGAVEFVHKPSQFDPAVLKELAEVLVSKVRAASTVNVLKLMRNKPSVAATSGETSVVSTIKKSQDLKLVTIGGNSGCSDALEKVITGLEADTPPVVVSCSTITTFLDAVITKLKPKSKVSLVIGKHGDYLRMGTVYFIPADVHGKVIPGGTSYQLQLEKSAPINAQLPSSNVLFSSAALAAGGSLYGILLSGFGSDGVEGLGEIQAKGGATTVQNPDEAQFPFAPQKAVEEGFADNILSSAEIANNLFQYRSKKVAA